MYLQLTAFPGTTLLDRDPEVADGYDGRLPGTLSISGYDSAYFDQQCRASIRYRPVVYTDLTAPPTIPFQTAMTRLADFRDFGVSTIGHTPAVTYQKLRALLGPDRCLPNSLGQTEIRNSHLAEAARISMRSQITELCKILNWNDPNRFVDLSKSRSICTHFLQPGQLGFEKFLSQVLLGYELLVRLRKEPATTSYVNLIGDKISANLLISDRWVRHIRIGLDYSQLLATSGPQFLYTFDSQIANRQVDGLLRFAELMSWPHIHETREYMENALIDLRSGRTVFYEIVDWLFGLILPGQEFRLRIMSCLALATESTRSMRDPPFYSSGLVLASTTYWPRETVMYRVLGGLNGVKSVCGWAGPCPPIDDRNIKGWIRVSARALTLPTPCTDLTEGMYEDNLGGSQRRGSHGLGNRNDLETDSEMIRRICDINEWVEPQLDIGPNNENVTILEKISLQALPGDTSVLNLFGYSTLERTEYRATLSFTVNGKSQSYILYTNPYFITAHPCTGTHILFRNQARWYTSNVVAAADLKTYRWDGKRFLVINALNEGEELLARAWCSEQGKHAIIRRGHGCCFACAAVMAGNAGLAVNLLIWA